MKNIRWLVVVLAAMAVVGETPAQGWRKHNTDVAVTNRKIGGKVIDHTANHGVDRRMWSKSLWERRDLYVYLPPGYHASQRYPLMIWLHGFNQDESTFLRHVVPALDAAIRSGKLPPLIVAAPDGSISGEPHPHCSGSFFLNTRMGSYADFVLYDVWDFVTLHYPVRPEREAHIIAGFSMGGFAAYNYAIKHPEAFGIVMGISPPLNLRWMNRKGKYAANFDPRDWGWRTDLGKGRDIIGHHGVPGNIVRCRNWFGDLFGLGTEGVFEIARENPIEMLIQHMVRPGDLEMYVAYTSQDELNIDAQVESFLYMATWQGLHVCVGYEVHGKHNVFTMKKFLPHAFEWLTPRIAPYSAYNGCHDIVPSSGADAPHAGLKRPLLKRRRNRRGTNPICDDPSCHLPPMWLPDVPPGQ